MARLFALALFLASADAFLLLPTMASRRVVPRPAINMGVEEAAMDCLESGCEIDDVTVLIEELQVAAKGYKSEQKNKALKLVAQLKELNLSPIANKNEIEKLVKAMGRSFGTVDAFTFPGEPLGYTGKVGTTTFAGKVFEQ